MSILKRHAAQLIPPLLVFMVFLGAWYIGSYVLLDEKRRFLLPPPHGVVREGFLDGHNLRELLEGLRSTASVALTGLFFSITIGMLFRDPHEPEQVDRAVVLPLRGRAADDPDAGARPRGGILVRL